MSPQMTLMIPFLLIFICMTIFWAMELVDIARRDFSEPSLKVAWFLLVFFLYFAGALAYFLIGKKQGTIKQ